MYKKLLHTFGDSFAAQNKNWIRTIQVRGGYDAVKINAVAGSSLYHLLMQLEQGIEFIKENDGVIITFTQHIRRFLNGTHYIATDYDNSDHFKTYIEHLYLHTESCLYGSAIIDKVIGLQIPLLPTRRVATFYGVDKETEKHSLLPLNPKPAIWELVNQFIDSQNKDFDIDYLKIESPNHWVNDPMYEQLFFNTYKDEIDKLVN